MTYDEVMENLKRYCFTELGDRISRDPFSTLFQLKRPSRWMVHLDMAHEYSSRQLTYDSNGPKAILTILTRLKNGVFPKGFFRGLPIGGFPHALAHWTSSGVLTRRKDIQAGLGLDGKGHSTESQHLFGQMASITLHHLLSSR